MCERIQKSRLRVPRVPYVGGAGGLEAQVMVEDERKWDGKGKGSPPEAVEKVPSTLLTDRVTN